MLKPRLTPPFLHSQALLEQAVHVYLCFVLFLARCATEAEPPEEEAALPSVTGNGLRCAGAEWEGVGRRDGCKDGYESHELCALLHSGW